MKSRNVAHFRFVDDHIVLAYSFQDLVDWVDEYLSLLATSDTGAKVNPDKVEPAELATYFTSRRKSRKRFEEDTKSATRACKLNPQFPSPLMTRTLALVSAIARTDFNLLEETELVGLTDQLEHMLLVKLPETEIPEKTRLSFAATRLMQLAECRLSNNTKSTELACHLEALDAELSDVGLSSVRRAELSTERALIHSSFELQTGKLDNEVGRAFTLLRKVLQERPDRVRLWTRAVQMCRQTGVQGLKDIFEDIRCLEHKEGVMEATLSAEYLMGNTLALLGYETLIAAKVVCDPRVAEWRRRAAKRFLQDVANTPIKEPEVSGRRWFLKTSWDQYCFGLYCADLILKLNKSGIVAFDLRLAEELLRIGEQRLRVQDATRLPVSWAWWAARSSLRELSSHAEEWVVDIARQLPPTPDSHLLWRFFPFDVPQGMLQSMRDDRTNETPISGMAGWWHDALSAQSEDATSSLLGGRNWDFLRALKNIRAAGNKRFVSLYEWCKKIEISSVNGTADPRTGEWTALEIVRQIGILISSNPEFSKAYVTKALAGSNPPLCLHPANFRVPQGWLTETPPTWAEWISQIRSNGTSSAVEIVPEELRIADPRYAPISSPEYTLFESVNQVRGLGLLLYGLLNRNFELPCIWNGPGHRDVLSLLPRLLLREMTCSSWTLGILQACLQSRAMENLFFLAKPRLAAQLDDDSLHDPQKFRTPEQVCSAISTCQAILKVSQLSTIDHRARQLTPISIEQLSRPNWGRDFSQTQAGVELDER